jgi:glycosyltransferase involved in cell wall biosynthesis
MRIAQIAPLYEAVPPSLYGGTERVVANLCDALSEAGHEVTLFAAGDSRTRARLCASRPQALRLDPSLLKSDLAAHLNQLQAVKRLARQFDILHFHTDLLHFPMFEAEAHKSVTTVHGRLDIPELAGVYQHWSAFGLVSISNSQRAALPQAHWLGTVHHGFSPEHYALNVDRPRSYLAFLGRLSPEKRPDVAIRIALRAGIPLRIAAKVDAADAAYFESRIRPLLTHPLVRFVGEISDAQKSDFLGHACALLFPIDWPEPFGLVMIEAMACGTPVIAWDCGSVPEVIDEGETGFIVRSIEQAAQAVARARSLDPQRIRAIFERRFSARIMADAYSDLYTQLLGAVRPNVSRAALG